MREKQESSTQSRVRTQSDIPLCSPDDAGNMANHFINQYLMHCRCVTTEEAILCLGMLSDRVDAVNDALTAQVQPVEDDHEHSEQEVAPATKEVIREPINKAKAKSRRPSNRQRVRR